MQLGFDFYFVIYLIRENFKATVDPNTNLVK